MALTVTIPGNVDADLLRRQLMNAVDALDSGITYVVEGDQLTLLDLDESHRATVESIIADHADSVAQRQQALAAYQSNLNFVADVDDGTVTQAAVVQQERRAALQLNAIMRVLNENGLL